jgi:nitroreductase
MRRLGPQPIPEADLRFVIEAATQAPSAANTQSWAFLIVQDPELKKRIGVLYRELGDQLLRAAAEGRAGLPEETRKVYAHALSFSERVAEVPALIVVCMREKSPTDDLSRTASFFGSIFPAVQNLLLAARSRGLGTTLTTLHLADEARFKEALGIPEEVQTVAMIPIGYPTGEWRRPKRGSASEVTHWDRWGEQR